MKSMHGILVHILRNTEKLANYGFVSFAWNTWGWSRRSFHI